MYKLLLVFASAAALKRPQRALAVRGGEIDPIQVGKGIVAASGLYAAFDPKGNLEKYGCKNIGKSGETLMRAGALGQLVFAAALNMDTENVPLACVEIDFLRLPRAESRPVHAIDATSACT